MKLITFAVPCYNSAAYLSRCVDSLLCGADDVEILLVNDGSTDETGAQCDAYAARFPDRIRAIHQPNGGHGEAVNRGLLEATGHYFKVVDSDDWLSPTALLDMLETLRGLAETSVDLLVCNYVYEKLHKNIQKTIRYTFALPQNRVFTWHDIGRFPLSHYMLMHSLIYKTTLLREHSVVLPKHTFYVDNLFAYVPLPYVKTIYYRNIDLYRYFIGRSDQSINERVMISRIDQQLHVTRLMIEAHDLAAVEQQSPKLSAYMQGYLSMMVTICSVLIIKSGLPENEQKRKELWQFIQTHDARLAQTLSRKLLPRLSNLSQGVGKTVLIAMYSTARRIFNFS